MCGFDKLTGKDYNYRRIDIEKDMLQYANIFCVKLCAYSVISNHTHLVIKIDDDCADRLTKREVLNRYHKIFRPSKTEEKFMSGIKLEKGEYQALKIKIATCRERLSSIS